MRLTQHQTSMAELVLLPAWCDTKLYLLNKNKKQTHYEQQHTEKQGFWGILICLLGVPPTRVQYWLEQQVLTAIPDSMFSVFTLVASD